MFEEKLKELGIILPETATPLASYIPATIEGKTVYTSGQVPIKDGKLVYEGKIGKDLSVEEGKEAAKLCAINCLSAIKSVAGSLNNVERILKLTVFVNSLEGSGDQPKVANGASDLVVSIFGEKGKHVRAAVGVSALPINSAVEVEMVAVLK